MSWFKKGKVARIKGSKENQNDWLINMSNVTFIDIAENEAKIHFVDGKYEMTCQHCDKEAFIKHMKEVMENS